jgi:hypothetical protein
MTNLHRKICGEYKVDFSFPTEFLGNSLLTWLGFKCWQMMMMMRNLLGSYYFLYRRVSIFLGKINLNFFFYIRKINLFFIVYINIKIYDLTIFFVYNGAENQI